MAVNVKINGVTYRATDDYSIKQQGGAISTTQLRVLLGLNPVPSILQQVQIYMDATLFFTGLVQRVSSPEYSSAYEANVFSIDVSSLECLFNHRLVTKNFYDYTYTSWTQVIQYLFDNYIAEENITMGAISTISTTFDSKYTVKDKKLTDVLNEIADAIGPASWWIDPATRQFYFRVAADFDIVTPPEHVREFKLVDEIGDIRTVEKITGASAGVVGSASNSTLRTTLAARTGGSGKIEYAESDNDIHSDTKATAEAGYRLNLHDETQKTITCICEDLAASAVYLSWPLDITINGVTIEGDFVVVERTIEARGPDLFSIRVTLKNNNYFARYGYSLKRVATIANNSIALLSDIAADSKLTPGEKITELARWNAELAAKAAYDAEADAYGVSRVAYDAAFTTLSTYLNAGDAWTSGTPAWFDGEAFTETTDIVGADYDDNWQVLLDAKRSLEINTRLAIQEAADEAIAAAHKASIRLKVSDQRIIRARNGDLMPAAIVLTSWYSDNGTAYAGRLQVELSVNGTDFVVDYQSSADEATHSYTVPVLYGSAFVILLRCRLYEAGGFSNILWETSAAINADPSAAAIYWGALTSAPTGDIQTNDYYFDNNTVASGGGKLRYWTGSAWAEMTSSHPLYATAMKTAMTDLMIWATAQGETVAAANAVFGSIVASEAFIDQLSATVLNAAIARINEYLAIGDNGYVAGPDGAGTTEGDLRTFLDRDEVGIQEWRSSAWKSLLRIGVDGPVGSRHSAITFGEDVASIYQLQKGNGRPVLDGEFVKRVDRELYIEEKTISSTSRDWAGIAWSPELGLFVAMTYDSTVCATSPDGIDWTERTISSTSRSWNGIAWSPELGLFITTAYGSAVCGLIRGYELCEVGAGIIESGSNAAGAYRKYSDGWMEQEGWTYVREVGMTNYSVKAIVYPVDFLSGTYPLIDTEAGGVKSYASGVPTSPADCVAGSDLNTTGHGFSSAATAYHGFNLYVIRGAVNVLHDSFYYIVTWRAIGRWRA